MSADSDLEWYFGTASKTWQGDAGLRSPGFARAGGPSNGAVAASAVEDGFIERTSAANFARSVEARLAQLTTTQAQALRLHYTESLPWVDAAAVLLAASRALLVRQAYGLCRKALLDARKARRRWDLRGGHGAMGAFLVARDRARGIRRSKGPIGIEVLRQALHDAGVAERQRLATQATALVEGARAAYSAAQVERGRTLQIADPRPWRRSS